MGPWDKRLRSPTLRTVTQNQCLGARYFPYEVLGAATYGAAEALRITDALGVLEEISNRGRCLVAIPGESRIALYFVEADFGRSRLIWYEPSRRLTQRTGPPRWQVTLDVETTLRGSTESSEVVRTPAHA